MLKIKRSRDCLIFHMGNPILERRHLYIEMAPVLQFGVSGSKAGWSSVGQTPRWQYPRWANPHCCLGSHERHSDTNRQQPNCSFNNLFGPTRHKTVCINGTLWGESTGGQQYGKRFPVMTSLWIVSPCHSAYPVSRSVSIVTDDVLVPVRSQCIIRLKYCLLPVQSWWNKYV